MFSSVMSFVGHEYLKERVAGGIEKEETVVSEEDESGDEVEG